MDLGIAGKTAIVCASSKGLGKACAMHLAAEGCTVIINGRNAETLNATADEIAAATGATVIPVAADVGTDEGRAALMDAAPAPDILINNNGGPPLKDFREISDAALLEGVTQNMVTPIALIRTTLDGMADRGFGRVVNITSSSVLAPIVGLDLSSGARAGLTAFLSGIARTVADRNVTINNVLPGRFDTDRLRGNLSRGAERAGMDVEAFAKQSAGQVPAKRFGTADEFGALCTYLCSAHAGYITGQNLLIDGGMLNRAF